MVRLRVIYLRRGQNHPYKKGLVVGVVVVGGVLGLLQKRLSVVIFAWIPAGWLALGATGTTPQRSIGNDLAKIVERRRLARKGGGDQMEQRGLKPTAE